MDSLRYAVATGILATLVLPACRTANPTASVKDLSTAGGQVGGCAVIDTQTGRLADLSHDQSPFVTLILNKPNVAFVPSDGTNAGCPTTIHEVISAFDAMPASSRHIFVVDELGDQTKADLKSDGGHRFVVSQRVGAAGETDADLFLAPLEGSPGKLATASLEVISYDPGLGVNVFFKFQDGQWHRQGDGSQIDPQKSQEVTAAPGQFLCQSCHPTGALNFKERKFPWNNWGSANGGGTAPAGSALFLMPPFAAPEDHLLNAWMNGDAALPRAGKVESAYKLQTIIEAGNGRLVHNRVSQVLAGGRAGAFPGQSLATLVREVMCEVGEVNLVSTDSLGRSRQQGGAPIAVPLSFFVADQLRTLTGGGLALTATADLALAGGELQPQLTLPSVIRSLSGDAYLAQIATQSFPDLPDAHDTIFAFFMPERSFTSQLVGHELVASGWLTQDTLADILMTDFPNALFSAQRCGLASTVPSVPAGAAANDPAVGMQAFINAWVANLNSSQLSGAAGLAQRLSRPAPAVASRPRVSAFLAACNSRSNTDPNGFAADVVKLLQQRREELRQDPHLNRGNQGFPQIVESPDLLPAAAVPALPGALHLQEDCTLGAQAPVIGPGPTSGG